MNTNDAPKLEPVTGTKTGWAAIPAPTKYVVGAVVAFVIIVAVVALKFR
jgi:hypothetical protein